MVSPIAPVTSQIRPAQNPLESLGQNLSALSESGLRQQAMRQQMRQSEAGFQQQQRQLSRSEALQQAQFLNRLAKSMRSSDRSMWPEMVRPHTGLLQQMGFDMSKLGQLDEAQLDAVIAQTDAILPQDEVTRDTVQSSDILPGGSVIKVMRSGSVVVEDSQGNPLQGDARQKAIDEAERRRIDLAGERTRVVEGTKQEVKTEAKIAEETRKNQSAFNSYQVAFDNLTESLGGVSSGPILGRFPAVTTNQQIAENARAILLPSLKTIFRSAGEGTFTDSDQRALEALIPNRTMTRDAQVSNLQAIDALVKAKLGMDKKEEGNVSDMSDDELFNF